jgi:hypothetical protein
MHSDVLDRVYRAQEAKGRKQGIEQGRVEAEQRDILRVLAVRLGAVPDGVAARVAQVSDSARLAVLLESAATATNLAEFERGLD